ncbi:ROK family protein [Paenibacillaceae bacterium WGS1546]|uniref:ROK family transcriptional regulator n=1 Tax=Cohnella sp. WGS1546 TaxID=3366810 RepID=UPI00372D146F
MAGNNTKILKQANKYLVLQCISTYEPVTIEDIVKKTNLSRPTVINSVKELTESETVIKNGYAESTGGRTAALLSTNADAYYAIGADFEFPKVRLAIANLKGTILASHHIQYSLDTTAEEILNDLPDRIYDFMHSSNVPVEKIEGLGMGISGILDANNGYSKFIERINGWKDIDIQSILERKLKMPVYIRNDVHLMGLVEKRFYIPNDTNAFIYVGLRSGVGSAIFLGNSIYEGKNGNAGFTGHITLDVNGPRCFCGQRGCLDVFAGELSLIERYTAAKGSDVHVGSGEEINLDYLVRKAEAGDEIAASILKDAGFYLGVAIANLVKTLEIPNVVVGGCPSIATSPFFSSVQQTADAHLKLQFEDVLIGCGRLAEHDYALGGCFLVFDHLFDKPKLKLQI